MQYLSISHDLTLTIKPDEHQSWWAGSSYTVEKLQAVGEKDFWMCAIFSQTRSKRMTSSEIFYQTLTGNIVQTNEGEDSESAQHYKSRKAKISRDSTNNEIESKENCERKPLMELKPIL